MDFHFDKLLDFILCILCTSTLKLMYVTTCTHIHNIKDVKAIHLNEEMIAFRSKYQEQH